MLVLFLFLALLAAANIAAARQLRAIFPRARRAVDAALLLGNAFLLAVPAAFLFGRADGPFAYARPILGPPFLLWQVFALGYTAASLLAFPLYGALRGLGAVHARWPAFWRRPTRLALAAYAALTAVGVWTALVPLETRVVPVPLAGLPPALDGYRIALLSDVHVGLFTREARLHRIAAAVRAARPDLVVLAGDLVDDEPRHIPKLARGLRGLAARDGVYAVLGNHEIYANAAAHLLHRRDLPFRILVNDAVRVERPGGTLALVGLGELAAREALRPRGPETLRLAPDWERALQGVRPGDFLIAAAHRPELFAEAKRRGIPLMLAGHSHGGQFGIPRLRWCLSGLFLRWHMGLYREGASALYVTTGVGYWVLPARVGVPPEIVVLVLRAARS